jgi:hypothetical protein
MDFHYRFSQDESLMGAQLASPRKVVLSSLNISKSEASKRKDGKHGASENQFSIMKFVKDDPNFEAFWQRFMTLQESVDII